MEPYIVIKNMNNWIDAEIIPPKEYDSDTKT